ncbi:CopG family ribbon-helix-helix protein [Promethearchaeum syntrophicum]|uniref:CopG family ribbon-helix-helix protein n=1 Tax=Promethearchaeum syntrophicum TaxID=2594042 RepID=A0A5B9DCN5_9ARCH|nr:ribbon-helix-helix protein, CopG family [Candidatus Prometheoarchaeum syntrophicum]QEE16647.1 Putative nickel-responsive regulator [Candidatus Prometheoarchaeum syntrophicum]
MESKYDRISFSLPISLRDEFESLRTQLNLSRSDAIRKAIQEYIIQESKKRRGFSNKQILGTITYIEKSHVHAHPPNQKHSHENEEENINLTESGEHSHDVQHQPYYVPREMLEFIKANEIQHSFLDIILSAMHIHAGAEKCMEIIAVKGKYERILDLYTELQTLTTIKTINLEIMEVF